RVEWRLRRLDGRAHYVDAGLIGHPQTGAGAALQMFDFGRVESHYPGLHTVNGHDVAGSKHEVGDSWPTRLRAIALQADRCVHHRKARPDDAVYLDQRIVEDKVEVVAQLVEAAPLVLDCPGDRRLVVGLHYWDRDNLG